VLARLGGGWDGGGSRQLLRIEAPRNSDSAVSRPRRMTPGSQVRFPVTQTGGFASD
jgi:hypothetical protein